VFKVKFEYFHCLARRVNFSTQGSVGEKKVVRVRDEDGTRAAVLGTCSYKYLEIVCLYNIVIEIERR
jgi:hypothetical protein